MAGVLHANGMESTVFELEAGSHVRTQGGMLDIHEDSGQRALHAAGLFDAFLTHIHKGGEAMRILDRHGTVLREEKDDGRSMRPEIERGTLRNLLLASLPPGAVRWGCRITAAHPVDGQPGIHEVWLADGTTLTTDLLVGADGAWSRIRPLLSDAIPTYAGISFIETDLLDANAEHPAEAAAMGAGMVFALGGDTGIMGHREPDGSLHVYLGHRSDENWIHSIDFTDTPTARARVLDLLDGWGDSLRGLIANADTALTPRRIHALPVGHSWDRVPGVTLIGDAAHLMSPFAGEGANLAMYDGSELARAIIDHPDDTEAALAHYEKEMFPRSAASAGESAESLDVIFAADAPRGLVEMFAKFQENDAADADAKGRIDHAESAK
jgi:2-polyprenyl-6-methoxyphenol hydroxylase-like FAD-dependent oxidoreductase